MNEATGTQTHGAVPAAHRDAGHEGAAVGHADPHDAQEHHPGSGQYVRIAVILAVITAIEVLIYYFDLNKATLIAGLFVLSIAKFALVAAYFMHLKFDNKIFTTFFAAGLAVAIAAFLAVLAMFRVIV